MLDETLRLLLRGGLQQSFTPKYKTEHDLRIFKSKFTKKTKTDYQNINHRLLVYKINADKFKNNHGFSISDTSCIFRVVNFSVSK